MFNEAVDGIASLAQRFVEKIDAILSSDRTEIERPAGTGHCEIELQILESGSSLVCFSRRRLEQADHFLELTDKLFRSPDAGPHQRSDHRLHVCGCRLVVLYLL